MSTNVTTPSDRRRLIASLPDDTLNRLAAASTGDEHRMAITEQQLRGGSVMHASDRLQGSAARLDWLLAGGDTADALIFERAEARR